MWRLTFDPRILDSFVSKHVPTRIINKSINRQREEVNNFTWKKACFTFPYKMSTCSPRYIPNLKPTGRPKWACNITYKTTKIDVIAWLQIKDQCDEKIKRNRITGFHSGKMKNGIRTDIRNTTCKIIAEMMISLTQAQDSPFNNNNNAWLKALSWAKSK